MDRYWLLTTTFYGTWLPGDVRGFVSRVRDQRPDEPASPSRREHDAPGTPYDADLAGLRRAAEEQMKGEPIWINEQQAFALLAQFQETATHRRWELVAVAIMANHLHIVVGVPGDPDPKKVLGDFKAYGSRPLNAGWGRPPSDTWWTVGGSTRKLANEQAVRAAIQYLRDQYAPLLVWVAPAWA
jgi:REP element-mobilizing transposase RayT